MSLLLALPWAMTAQPAATQAQKHSLHVASPTSRIVFQRNNASQAVIPIQGLCPTNTDRVEARLVPRRIDQGTATDWIALNAAPTRGTFSGQLQAQAGWYDLDVRAWSGKSILGTTQEQVRMDECLRPASVGSVAIRDSFWAPKLQVYRQKTIPHSWFYMQWELRALRKAAGQPVEGDLNGTWGEANLYKFLETASYSLAMQRDPPWNNG